MASTNSTDIDLIIENYQQDDKKALTVDKTFQKKHQEIFTKYFEYLGHVPETKKFKAVCRTCKTQDRSTGPKNFDNHNFKHNSKRHYLIVHPETKWKEDGGHHKIQDFFSTAPFQPTLSDKDPFQKIINNCYLDLICVDGLPLNVTNGIGFQHLMSVANARVRVTDRRSLTRILDKRVKQNVRPELIAELNQLTGGSFHISTDIWSTRRGDGIVAVRGQFITEQEGGYRLKTQTLGLKQFNDRHNAANIRGKVSSILQECNILENKIGYILTDGAANMIAAFKQFKYGENNNENVTDQGNSKDHEPEIESEEFEIVEDDEEPDLTIDGEIEQMDQTKFTLEMPAAGERMSCFVHTLQLVVNDALKKDVGVKKLISDVKRIVKYFNKATFWKNKLRERAKKDLIQPAPTRWSSYYDTISTLSEENMYRSVMETMFEAKTSEKSSNKIHTLPDLPARSLLVEVGTYLSFIASSTDALQGNGVTSSQILYQIASCFDDIAAAKGFNFLQFKSSLLSSLKSRFEKKLQEKCVMLAAILDPRQKTNVFDFQPSEHEGIRLEIPNSNKAGHLLREEFAKLQPMQSQDQVPVKQRDTMFAKLHRSSQNQETSNVGEIDKYLFEERRELDPLIYWHQNKNLFPVLSTMAVHYLSIPASTGDVERLFSTAGAILRARRNCITPKNLENIILLKENRLPTLIRWKEAREGNADAIYKRKIVDAAETNDSPTPTKKSANIGDCIITNDSASTTSDQ